ncbi:MAG: hypothetical protein Kow0037_16790 [Calditrichia bacterium]
MKKVFLVSMLTALMALLLLTGCRPPELEGVVVNMNQGLNKEAFDLAKEAVKKYPNNPEAWYRLGLLYEKVESNYEKMNECFDKSLAVSPQFAKEIDLVRNNLFAENYNNALGSYYKKAREEQDPERRKKLYAKAAELFSVAHKIMPNRIEPLIPMYVSYLEIGDTTTAKGYLDKAVEMNPDNVDLLIGVGDFYTKINEVEKATFFYKKALETEPESVVAHLALGEALAAQKQWDEAIKHFDYGMQKDPTNPAIPLRVGAIYSDNGRYEEAIPYFKKKVELTPEDQDSYEYLSVSYMQAAQKYMDQMNQTEDEAKQKELRAKAMKIFDEAMPFLESAVQKFPKSALLWNNLGICYAQKGMKDKAKEAFQKQAELESN